MDEKEPTLKGMLGRIVKRVAGVVFLTAVFFFIMHLFGYHYSNQDEAISLGLWILCIYILGVLGIIFGDFE